LPGRWTFELGDLLIPFIFQAGSEAFEQIRPGKDPLAIPEMLAEIVGEGPIVAPLDVGIRRGLVVPAPCEEDMVARIGRTQKPGLRKVLLIKLPAKNVNRRLKKPGTNGLFQRKGGHGRSFSGPGTGMTAVQQHLQVRPLRKSGEEGLQLVIHNVGPVPVHVIRAEDLIEVVLQFISIPVPDL